MIFQQTPIIFNKLVDKLKHLAYNNDRYRDNCRMAWFWVKKMVKTNRKAVLYENTKIFGGLIAALMVVIGIAINVFTLPHRVTVVETKMSQSETRITLIESKLDSLIHDNKEIKADIKELLKKRGN